MKNEDEALFERVFTKMDKEGRFAGLRAKAKAMRESNIDTRKPHQKESSVFVSSRDAEDNDALVKKYH